MARKTIFFFATIVATWTARGFWDYHPKFRDVVAEHPWQSFGLLIIGAASVALMVWGILRPSSWKVVSAFGLGIATALWGGKLFEGIGWQQVGAFAGCVALLAVLWALTVLDTDHQLVQRARQRLRIRRP